MSYEGAITPASIKLPSAPTRTNYNFQGWTDEANSETSKWSASQAVTFKNKENTVYAAWKQGFKCNYCGQFTIQEHYNCPSHFSSQPCMTYSKTCTYTVPCNNYQTWSGTLGNYLNMTCVRCTINIGGYSQCYYTATNTKCSKCGKDPVLQWCTIHGSKISAACPNTSNCGKYYVTNHD